MKSGSIILSFVVITLLLFPCDDVTTYFDSEFNNSLTLSHDYDDHDDVCSPFCTCQCCQSHVTQTCMLCLANITFFVSIPSDRSQQMAEQLTFAIWDPPRLMS